MDCCGRPGFPGAEAAGRFGGPIHGRPTKRSALPWGNIRILEGPFLRSEQQHLGLFDASGGEQVRGFASAPGGFCSNWGESCRTSLVRLTEGSLRWGRPVGCGDAGRYHSFMSRVMDWDEENVPPVLESLPPGRYVVERLDEALARDAQEEEGVRQALASLEAGRGSTLREVQERLLKKLGDR